MEYIIEVPYIAQETNATCWNAAYKMMLKYKNKPVSGADSLPNDAQMRERGILDPEFPVCPGRAWIEFEYLHGVHHGGRHQVQTGDLRADLDFRQLLRGAV